MTDKTDTELLALTKQQHPGDWPVAWITLIESVPQLIAEKRALEARIEPVRTAALKLLETTECCCDELLFDDHADDCERKQLYKALAADDAAARKP